MNVLLIGEGEIGKAIKSLEEKAGHDVDVLELKEVAIKPGKEYEICHVCIPFNKNFIDSIENYLKSYKPKLTIIHSTVGPGTTSVIQFNTKMRVVHSPVMGMHENMTKHISTFTKMLAGEPESCKYASVHYAKLRLKYFIVDNNPMTTEMGKLLSTSYYAWNILFAKKVKDVCDTFGLDYDKTYTRVNEIYNDGYTKLDIPHVIRPILVPPEEEGLGGHCLYENAEILKSLEFNETDEITTPILKLGKKKNVTVLD